MSSLYVQREDRKNSRISVPEFPESADHQRLTWRVQSVGRDNVNPEEKRKRRKQRLAALSAKGHELGSRVPVFKRASETAGRRMQVVARAVELLDWLAGHPADADASAVAANKRRGGAKAKS